MFNYYSDLSFLQIDTYLLLSYFFENPFKVSTRFLRLKGESDLYTYGETPLTTLDRIARECQLSMQDVVIELGCGRGRTCFWLRQFIGCAVVGVDYVPTFIQRAQEASRIFKIESVTFREEDLFQSDLKGATVIYLYGTSFSTAAICRLITRFEKLPQGTKFITVSYALTDYQTPSSFTLIKTFDVPFTWGMTTVYLQVKN